MLLRPSCWFFSPPEFPATQIRYLYLSPSLLEVSLQATGALYHTQAQCRRDSVWVGQWTPPEQTLIHEEWEAVIWRDNSEIVYSEDLQEESIYWLFFFNLFCLAFSISTPVHSRSTLQINHLRPSFCLRILEKLKLRHAALSNPILWS